MTDEEIKAVVAKYIIGNHESDNADCLHESDEFYGKPEDPEHLLNRAYALYRSAKVTVTWDQPGEGGVREPSGDSPDSPAPGEPGIPGDDRIRAALETPGGDTRLEWPVISPGTQAMTVWSAWLGADGSLNIQERFPDLEEIGG